MEKKITVQNNVIVELKENLIQLERVKEEPKNEIDRLKREIEDLGNENKEKINRLENMEKENLILKEMSKIEKEKCEIEIEKCEIEKEKIEEFSLNIENITDNVSLSEELRLVDNFGKLFECELCENTFGTRRDLKSHLRIHNEQSVKTDLLSKLKGLEADNSENKCILLSKLLELKTKEDEEEYICRCKGFCTIRHKFYNWCKPKSIELLNKSRCILGYPFKVDMNEDSKNDDDKAQVEECYQCSKCDETFLNAAELKNHLEILHPMHILQTFTCNPWDLAFLDLLD